MHFEKPQQLATIEGETEDMTPRQAFFDTSGGACLHTFI